MLRTCWAAFSAGITFAHCLVACLLEGNPLRHLTSEGQNDTIILVDNPQRRLGRWWRRIKRVGARNKLHRRQLYSGLAQLCLGRV